MPKKPDSEPWSVATVVPDDPAAQKRNSHQHYELECPNCKAKLHSDTAKLYCPGCKAMIEIQWPAEY